MRDAEKERQVLINRLKKVKDPVERDRIIWALAGQEAKDAGRSAVQMSPPRSAVLQTQTERRPPVEISEQKDLPAESVKAQRMLGFIVPGFFLIFGFMRIAQSLLNYFESGEIETEMMGLFAGTVFLLIGVVGIFRVMRAAPIRRDDSS